jgi:hypothetical protein
MEVDIKAREVDKFNYKYIFSLPFGYHFTSLFVPEIKAFYLVGG